MNPQVDSQPRRHLSELLRPFIWLAIVIVTAFLVGSWTNYMGRQKTLDTSIIRGETMGTTYEVRIAHLEPIADPLKIKQSLDAELTLVNQQMSTYIADSEVGSFNSSTSTDWFPVSKETAHIVAISKELTTVSEGYFDVTVMPLVNAWSFGPGKRTDRAPTQEEVSQLLARVGSDKLEVRKDPPALKKSVAELQVDLSAIAKGHGSDRVASVLDSLGFENYFVEIGGEIVVKGNRADGRPWQVGIEAPTEDERSIQMVVGLTSCAMATSGDYRNFFVEGGKKYSHTIDPKTGYPVQNMLASASVIADNCALADGWATTMMALGSDKALALAEKENIPVLLIVRKENKFELLASRKFDERFPQWRDNGANKQ